MPKKQRLPNSEQYFFSELPALYEAAVKFRDLAPWQWMRDSDTFAVQSPDTGEIVYCSVMGAVGEFYGISCYRGEEGYLVLDEMYNQADPFNRGKSIAQKVNVPVLSPDGMKYLKSLPVQKMQWELDYFYMSPILDPGENRPVFPRVLTVIDRSSQAVLAHRIAKPDTFVEEIYTALLDAISSTESRPAQILIRRQGELHAVVGAFIEMAGGMSYDILPHLALTVEIQREIRQILMRGR